nr:hypothetical protein [Burkholderiales bacterium]
MGVSLIGGAAGIVVPVNTSPTKPPLSLFSGGNRQGNVSPPKAGLNGSTGFSRDMSPGKLFAYFFNSGNSHKEIHSLEITPSNSDNYSLPSSLSGSDSLDENYNSKSHSPISPLSASPSSDGSAHKESTTLYNSGTSIINQVRNKEISHEEKSALVHAIDLIKTTPDIKKLLVSIIEIKGVDCFNLVRSRLYLRNYLIILVYFKHQLQTKGKFTNFEFDKDEFNKFKGWLEDNYTGDMASLNLQQNDCEKIKVVNGVVKHTLHENDYNMQVKIDKLNLNRNEIKVRAMRNFEYNIVGNLWDDILKVYAYCEHMVYDFFMQTRGVNKNLLPSRRLDSRLALNKRWDIANKDELMRCFNASYGDVPLKNGTFWQIGKTQYAGYNKPADLEKLFSPIFEAVKIMEDVDSLNLFIHMFTSGVRNPHVMGVKVYKYTNLVDTTLNYFKCYFIDPHSKNDEVGHTVNLYPERFKDREYIRNVSHHIVQRLHSLRQAVARKDAIFLRFICLYPKELRTITSKINLLPETFESALTVLGGEGHIFKYKEDFILAWLMYDDSNIGNILGKKIIVQQLMEKMIKSEVLSSCMTTAKAKNN